MTTNENITKIKKSLDLSQFNETDRLAIENQHRMVAKFKRQWLKTPANRESAVIESFGLYRDARLALKVMIRNAKTRKVTG